jgi:two-component system chemotaxis response regulator CheB
MSVRRDIVVIGGSAGGVEALLGLVAGLPGDLGATLLVALHTSRRGPGVLAELLSRSGPLPAEFASDGQRIRSGRILIAPPDMHMLVEAGAIRLVHGPHENGFRPAIDPLFRTTAEEFGSRVIGVILSGALDDGSHGLQETSGAVACDRIRAQRLLSGQH